MVTDDFGTRRTVGAARIRCCRGEYMPDCRSAQEPSRAPDAEPELAPATVADDEITPGRPLSPARSGLFRYLGSAVLARLDPTHLSAVLVALYP